MLDLNAFKMFESVLDAPKMFDLVPKDRRRPQDARKAKSNCKWRGGAGAQHWHRRPLQLLPAEVSVVLTDANLGASQLWQRAGESGFSEEFLQARTTRARPGTGKRRPLELDRELERGRWFKNFDLAMKAVSNCCLGFLKLLSRRNSRTLCG